MTNGASTRPSPFTLNASAFVGGAVVMTLELLGSRLLSPRFGNDLYVWSSLIGMAILAMTAGYFLGGRLADRGVGRALLPALVGTAGIWAGLVAVLWNPVTTGLSEVGNPWGACLAALVLLGPPLFLLAAQMPALVRLAVGAAADGADAGPEVGRRVGQLAAVGTIGSVAGTLVTGYWLLGVFGIRTISFACAAVLVAWALVLALAVRPQA